MHLGSRVHVGRLTRFFLQGAQDDRLKFHLHAAAEVGAPQILPWDFNDFHEAAIGVVQVDVGAVLRPVGEGPNAGRVLHPKAAHMNASMGTA